MHIAIFRLFRYNGGMQNKLIFPVLFVAGCLDLCAGEVWTLGAPRTWSRDNTSTLKILDATGFEIRHSGGLDWCVSGIDRIPVKVGDTFRFTCDSEKLADGFGGRPFELSVVTYDAKGHESSWTYAPAEAMPGAAHVGAFMIPPGIAAIWPRVVGNGPCGAIIRNVKIERTGNLMSAQPKLSDQMIGNGLLQARVFADGSGFAVTDTRTGRTWAPAPASAGQVVLTELKKTGDDAVAVTFVNPQTLKRWSAVYRMDAGKAELSVRVHGEGDMSAPLAYPAPFASSKGDRLIVPMNEGISYPADEPDSPPRDLIAYGGHGICMAFFGVQSDATGAGWMGIFETPDDAALRITRAPSTQLLQMGPTWHDQKKRFGYDRVVRYVFLDKGGYVAMAKRYRAYAKAIGKFKPFSEKVKARPNVDRLLGAVNVWCWDKDKLAVVKALQDTGIDRILWSGDGSAEQVAAMAKMPKVLVSRYDVYQDIYHPDQLAKLGWKHGSNTEAWPNDIVWNGPTSNDWRHAWGVKAKDGTWTWCAMMCDRVAPDYERRNVAKELVNKPFNTRFIDTTVAAPWQTCWNPRHPMTRSDSRHWKMELLRILGDEFNLVVGSETGHDASVPFCDYYEGMLSLGPYRVPDSGRNIPQIWTNVPPRVAKYQVGEQYRLPLWELVYHECVCAHWYWGDYNNKLPDIWWKRDLFNQLYGTMGMFIFNQKQWRADKDKFARSFKLTSPIARATGYSEMVEHRILTPDREVQQSVFANGTVVTVNFGDQPYTLVDGTVVEARGSRVGRNDK